MTRWEAHEAAMTSYARARVLDGFLPELAAQDAVKIWTDAGVAVGTKLERAALIERLSVAATQPVVTTPRRDA